MLTALSVENFRAFKTQGVRLSKINIFVGPNNSGKSSIISAVNLIAQNMRGNSSEFSLKLNGPYAQLGTFYDVVHGHSSRSRIRLRFTLNSITFEYRFRYRPQRREIDLVRVSISDGESSFTHMNEGDTPVQLFESKSAGQIHIPRTARVRFRGLYMILSLFDPHLYDESEASKIQRQMRDFIGRAMRNLERHFTVFDAVDAFRAAPERTYYYTGEAPTNVGRHGENFAQMLASSAATRERASVNVLKRAAAWFRASGVANDIKINALTNRHFELVVVDDTGSTNNISDSGLGCSQVLPVLVAGFALVKNRRTLTPPMLVAQEPEIHLHPTAAAHLGTYFTELARDGIQCFIETHSENLILRVARHVALGHLTPDDVRIYWVCSESGEHKASELKLRKDGTFMNEWPAGFFPTRAAETLQLARASSGIDSNDNLKGYFVDG